jgi:hypothetical protein
MWYNAAQLSGKEVAGEAIALADPLAGPHLMQTGYQYTAN